MDKRFYSIIIPVYNRPEEVDEYFSAMMDMLTAFGATDWITYCGIELE